MGSLGERECMCWIEREEREKRRKRERERGGEGEEGRNQFPGRYFEEQRGAPSFPRENATDR